MVRIKSISIEGYRSIADPVDIVFPNEKPVVLMGENNAGKSNIVHALDRVMGELYPGTRPVDDNDFYGRNPESGRFQIEVNMEGLSFKDRYGKTRTIDKFEYLWDANDQASQERPFKAVHHDGYENYFVSNEVRNKCVCITVGADRRLSYQLSYLSRYTFLSKLTRKFHADLMSSPELVEELNKKYDEIVKIYRAVDRFAAFDQELQSQVEELSSSLPYKLSVDFSAYDPTNYYHSLRVRPREGDSTRSFEELGTGQEQILAIAFAYAYARAFHDEANLLLVIEEPEAHLHPLNQRWVATKLHEIAAMGVQVFVTTHSAAFLDIMNLDGFVRVFKEDGCTCVQQRSADEFAAYCAANGAPSRDGLRALQFYEPHSTEEILNGFFARKVVLVEGATESFALPIYLGKAGLDNHREGIAIVPVGGVGNLAKWWRLFTAFDIPCYVVLDNDHKSDTRGDRRSNLLETLGIDEREREGIMESEDWIVADSYCVFGGDFETILRNVFAPYYTELENEAREEFELTGEGLKPLLARHVAKRLQFDEDAEGWIRLSELSRAIQALGVKDAQSFTGSQT